MKTLFFKLGTLAASFAFVVAIAANGVASWFGAYQPEEPASLRK